MNQIVTVNTDAGDASRHPYARMPYAAALSHIGQPVDIPEWGTAVVLRPINGGFIDAVGPYPLCSIMKSSDIEAGFERLREIGVVSFVAVVDTFTSVPVNALEVYFDIKQFKNHFVYDSKIGPIFSTGKEMTKIRKTMKEVSINVFSLGERLAEWTNLYDELCNRHDLRGVHRFPREYHEMLAHLPEAVPLGAFKDNQLVACVIWIRHNRHVYSHLTASNSIGYQLRAVQALNYSALEIFKDCETIGFGGGAGSEDSSNDGLADFKRRFSNSTRPAFLCTKVIDKVMYQTLTSERTHNPDFFPAYRSRM